jgi:hypothetical protein
VFSFIELVDMPISKGLGVTLNAKCQHSDKKSKSNQVTMENKFYNGGLDSESKAKKDVGKNKTQRIFPQKIQTQCIISNLNIKSSHFFLVWDILYWLSSIQTLSNIKVV